MRVMAARSAGVARRMGTDMCFRRPTIKRPGVEPGRCNGQSVPCASAAVAEEAQQEEEQVDEVEVKRKRTHHRFAADDGAVFHRMLHLLDPLGATCRQSGEADYSVYRKDEV